MIIDPMELEAPLVHLVTKDHKCMTQQELQSFISTLREIRSSPQTMKAKTERKPKKTGTTNIDHLL